MSERRRYTCVLLGPTGRLTDKTDGQFGEIDSRSLKLSAGIARRMSGWGAAWAVALDDVRSDLGVETDSAMMKLRVQGYRLAADVQEAVGPHITVIFHNGEETIDRPFGSWRTTEHQRAKRRTTPLVSKPSRPSLVQLDPASGLVDRSANNAGAIDPGSLGLAEDLVHRILTWRQRHAPLREVAPFDPALTLLRAEEFRLAADIHEAVAADVVVMMRRIWSDEREQQWRQTLDLNHRQRLDKKEWTRRPDAGEGH